jgi:hypothetical protein
MHTYGGFDMTNITKLFILSVVLLLTGCYPGISGWVVDGVTGNPLEGAVVLAQWTQTNGLPGLTSHSVYKTEETETDKKGMFSLAGVYYPFVDRPEMVIYKKGYVPWRNDMDFFNPTWRHYEKNIWQDNLTYRLNRWKEGYSKEKLDGFICGGIDISSKIPIFQKRQIELSKEVQQEIDLKKINNK